MPPPPPLPLPRQIHHRHLRIVIIVTTLTILLSSTPTYYPTILLTPVHPIVVTAMVNNRSMALTLPLLPPRLHVIIRRLQLRPLSLLLPPIIATLVPRPPVRLATADRRNDAMAPLLSALGLPSPPHYPLLSHMVPPSKRRTLSATIRAIVTKSEALVRRQDRASVATSSQLVVWTVCVSLACIVSPSHLGARQSAKCCSTTPPIHNRYNASGRKDVITRSLFVMSGISATVT